MAVLVVFACFAFRGSFRRYPKFVGCLFRRQIFFAIFTISGLPLVFEFSHVPQQFERSLISEKVGHK